MSGVLALSSPFFEFLFAESGGFFLGRCRRLRSSALTARVAGLLQRSSGDHSISGWNWRPWRRCPNSHSVLTSVRSFELAIARFHTPGRLLQTSENQATESGHSGVSRLLNWRDMDVLGLPANAIAFTLWMMLLILRETEVPAIALSSDQDGEDDDHSLTLATTLSDRVLDAENEVTATLHHFRLSLACSFLQEDLGFWVKPRSTTWFSRFLLEQYDNQRWVEMFRMTKPAVLSLSEVLRPYIERENTKYRLAIPVLIRVACTLFKLAHGANLTVCSEMFAIGRSTVSVVLRDVVNAINVTLRHEILWPSGDRIRQTEEKFYQLCGLPGVVGAIDGTHVAISKPSFGAADYYYFKSGGYTINCQAVVDSEKRFLDLYLGMPGSTNDSRVLRRSSLYNLAMQQSILSPTNLLRGFSPYLIGDLGYPLQSWLMIPHKAVAQLSVSEALYNRRLRCGRVVVENAFGILKNTFRELLYKTDLHVTFIPDVILCCAILHNILLGQSHNEVEDLLEVLRDEGLYGAVVDEEEGAEDPDAVQDHVPTPAATQKRTDLGLYLSMQRRAPPP